MDLSRDCIPVFILFNYFYRALHVLYLFLYLVVLVEHILPLLVEEFELSSKTELK